MGLTSETCGTSRKRLDTTGNGCITFVHTSVLENVKVKPAMPEGKFVSYLRVSTAKQGASGLGLAAQRTAVANFLNGGRWKLIAETVEVESGKRDNRPKLAQAMALCRLHDATLVVAKLDRLSRDAAFLMNLQKAGVRFIAADMPEANEMTVGIMAVVAQAERKAISKRTKEALAAKAKWYAGLGDDDRARLTAKGKAVKLGGPKWDHLAGAIGDKGRAAGIATRQARASSRVARSPADHRWPAGRGRHNPCWPRRGPDQARHPNGARLVDVVSRCRCRGCWLE